MSSSKENRLAKEASPYLQQHAKNPVDWYAWGDEALAEAKRSDRPILLSIGYSACHWCHVMERESFENEEIAAKMNALFVNVKVDREERPDLDQIYQLVVQLLGRNGGWPLTVFLTPEQKPFFGGTYFPPTDRYGMPGFPKVLEAISDAYKNKRDDVFSQAGELAEAIAAATKSERSATAGPAYTLGPDLLTRAMATLGKRFDDEHPGFGQRPKFPNTMSVEVMLRHGMLERDNVSATRARAVLHAMRAGGIYDHLGGGFHRYSTDERWLVPHFEKMLYDNALLLKLYADGFQAFGDVAFRKTAEEIAAYVKREMTAPDGGFFATQDADSEGEEGKFFVWSAGEIRDAMGDDIDGADFAISHFGVTDEGNFEHTGKTVLSAVVPLDEIARAYDRRLDEVDAALARAQARLLLAREARVKPFRDEKVMASWNGLMISALARAGSALGNAEMLEMATRAFAFVEAKLLVADSANAAHTRVLRHAKGGVAKGPGFLDDAAFVACAAIDLYEATAEPRYIGVARAILDATVAHFWDGAAGEGGFFFTADDGEALIHRAKDPFDHAIPSGTSMACLALSKLGALVDATYETYATRELERLAPAAIDNPFGMSQTICVLDRLVRGATDVVVVGPRDDERTRALGHGVARAYLPNLSVAWLDPKDDASRAACALLADGKPAREVPVAYICRGRTCSAPIDDAVELALTLSPALADQPV